MPWDILLGKLMAAALLPPGINLLLILLGILLAQRWRQTGLALFFIGVITLYALATPFVAENWMAQWQPVANLRLALMPENEKDAAIVVLGGGRSSIAPEYDGIDTVNQATLERLRYAARLQKKTHLPVLLSGGKVYGEPTPEAVLMNDVFISDFGGAPTWLETRSHNTEENAKFSLPLLRARGIKKVYLVTHAWHMPRSVRAFNLNNTDIDIVAAPMGYVQNSSGDYGLFAFLPRASALLQSSWVMQERLGLLRLELAD